MKKNLSYFTIIIVFLMATLLVVKIVLKKKRKQTTVSVSKTINRPPLNIKAMIAAQETQLWNELHQLDVTHEEVNTVHTNTYAEYRVLHSPNEYYPKIKDPIISLIRDVMHTYEMDTASIRFIAMKSNKIATSNDFILFINPELFSSYSVPAQKFIVAHELYLIKSQSSSHYFALKQALLNKAFDKHKECRRILSHYYQFQRRQADVAIALMNESWALSYKTFVQETIQRIPAHSPEYSFYQERLELAQDILTHHYTQ